MDSGKRFDPTKYLRTIKVRGGTQQTYLPVTARLLWLRADHPDAQVVTEALKLDEKGAVFKATVSLPSGAVAVGHGSETAGDFGDFIEKAETKAIGRALTALGYGTEFAEIQDDPTIAAATEVSLAPVAPRASEPIPLPATTSLPSPAATPPTALRPERRARQQETAERPERAERSMQAPEPATERVERPERTERLARQTEPAERTERPERFTPTPRTLPSERPSRPERAEPAEDAPRPAPITRTLRPERLSRARDTTAAPPAPAAPPEPVPPAEEPPAAPTPIRRSGRTLAAGRTFATQQPAGPAAPETPPTRATPRAEEPADGADDEIEMAMISTTSFWRWARSKGFADRAAVEAAIGKSMDAMTPREAYYRLKEVLAREGNA